MLQTEYAQSAQGSEAASPDVPESDSPQPGRERVRLLIYGPPRAIEHTINQLHVLGFVDRDRWTTIAEMPENGIHIPREEDESYSFLLREVR